MPTPARPTLRCLREDLDNEWDDPSQRTALSTVPLRLPPFHDLAHPLVRHTANAFDGLPPVPGSERDIAREGIRGLKDPMWWKARTGSRWRGAVWEDGDGQAWLCAAGLRREREDSDFYKQFMWDVTGGGHAQFMPTDDDYKRLRLEQGQSRLDAWQQDVHRGACEAFLAAAETGMPADLAVPALGPDDVDPLTTATVEVVVVADDDDPGQSLVEVVIAFTRRDWSRADVAEHADLVVLSAVQPDEQSWDASSGETGPIYSFVVPQPAFDAVLGAVDADGPPCASRPGEVAHYTHRGRLTEAVVVGSSVKGMCGAWYVPRQDHEGKPVCPTCDAAYRALPDLA